MGFLSNLTNQFGVLINSQSTARRLLLLGVVLGSVGCMVWLIIYAHTGGWSVLYTGMQQADAGDAVAKLRQLGIECKLDDGGTTIKVPSNRSDDAAVMLAMEGIPNSGVVGYEMMDENRLGQSKFQQEKNYHRMLEGELSRTVMSLPQVERARVHLALPDHSLFVEEEKQPTASVVLNMHAGSQVNDRQLNGIIHLVSHAVQGLTPENVSVVDHNGNLLNLQRRPEMESSTLAQQNFKTNYEETLKARIESMLEKWIGPGRVAARVQANFDFSTLHEVREIYNPEDQEPIVRSEQAQTQAKAEFGQSGSGVKGPAGSPSALPPSTQGGAAGKLPQGQDPRMVRSDRTVEYAVSNMQQESKHTMPSLKRVSVAVLVDGKYESTTNSEGEEINRFQPRGQDELKQIEEMVKATIGYTNDQTRQDLVTVQCAPFTLDTPQEVDLPIISYEMREMIEIGLEWTIVGLIGFLLVMVVLRPAVKGIVVTPARTAALPSGGMAHLAGSSSSGAGLGSGETNSLSQNQQGTGQSLSEMIESMKNEEIPPEVAQDPERVRQYREQRIAMQKAKLSNAESKEIQEQITETAKNDPKKTVGLLRQWMDEA